MKLKCLLEDSLYNNMRSNSEYVGAIGRREMIKLTAYSIKRFSSRYGFYYIYTFYDEKLNMLVYRGRLLSKEGDKKEAAIDIKSKHTIEFKVKKHIEFNGIKQTIIARPKVLT